MNRVLVHVFLKESNQPLVNVSVSLFDRDRRSSDDLLGVVNTDRYGRAWFRFGSSDFFDGLGDDDQFLDFTPELYAKAYGKDGEVVGVSRQSPRHSSDLKISIPHDVALQNGLINHKERPSSNKKKEEWINSWKDYAAKNPSHNIDDDFCITHLAFQVLGGLNDPQTNIQKQSREILENNHAIVDFQEISKQAQESLLLINDSAAELNISLDNCTNDIDQLAKKMLEPEGTLNPLVHYFTGELSLMDELGDPRAGLPFTKDPDFEKDCLASYENTPPSDRDSQLSDMHRIIEDNIKQLIPPSINHIKVYETDSIAPKREAYVNTKELTLNEFGLKQGQIQPISHLLQMNVPIEHETSVINKTDDTGNQILATDVIPGQSIVLRGSGFIAEKAKVRVRHFSWNSEPTNQGLLNPNDLPASVIGFSNTELAVHNIGNDTLTDNDTVDTYTDNLVMFDWPISASEPGLYELILEFENSTRHPSEIVQDSSDCSLNISFSPVKSQKIYFMRLPEQLPAAVRVHSTRIECLDETNPEIPMFDDIFFSAQGMVDRYVINESNPELSTIDNIVSSDLKSRNFVFWEDGESEIFSDLILPADSISMQLLKDSDILTLALQASEVFGLADRVLLSVLVIGLVVVIAIIVTAIIVAAIFAIATTAGLATPVIVKLMGVGATILGPLLKAAAPALVAAIVLIFAEQPAGLLVASAVPKYTGKQIKQMLSPYRFNRLLYPPPQTSPQLMPGGMIMQQSLSIGNLGQLVDRTRCIIPGSDYALTVTITPQS